MKHSATSTVVGHDVGFRFPNGSKLFSGLEFSFSPGRHGIVGPAESGKSVLSRLLIGALAPMEGSISWTIPKDKRLLLSNPSESATPKRIADELGIGPQIEALRKLEAGSSDPELFETLADSWDVEERGKIILEKAGLRNLNVNDSAEALSPEQRIRVHLARLELESPELLIFDESIDLLGNETRRQLRKALSAFDGTLIIVGNDRFLLENVDSIWELSERGLTLYGGNYSFYYQRRLAETALAQEKLAHAQHELERRRALADDALARQAHRIDHARRFADTGMPKVHRGNMKRRSQETMAKVAHRHEALVKEAERRVEDALETRRLVDSTHLEES